VAGTKQTRSLRGCASSIKFQIECVAGSSGSEKEEKIARCRTRAGGRTSFAKFTNIRVLSSLNSVT
jgi:hypothetical protein